MQGAGRVYEMNTFYVDDKFLEVAENRSPDHQTVPGMRGSLSGDINRNRGAFSLSFGSVCGDSNLPHVRATCHFCVFDLPANRA